MDTLNKFYQSILCFCILFIITFFYLSFIVPNSANAASTLIPFNDSNWKYYDVDNTNGTPGQYIMNSNEFIHSAGVDVWTGSDEYVTYYRNNLSGDWDVVVQVVSQENTNSWAKAGLMVKNNLRYSASNSNGTTGYCMVAVTPENGYAFQADLDGNKYLEYTHNVGSTSYPVWLRLKKTGTTFTGYYSHSSNNPPLVSEWTQIDSQIVTTANTTQDIGLFVSSHNTSQFCEVQFSKFYLYDHSIPSHTITASAGSNGSISPSGSVSVTDGYNQLFSITPNTGYKVQTLTVDGSSIAVQNSYTFTNVTADHSISATFAITTNNITATEGANGSISPSGVTAVNYGSSQTYTVTPDSGYRVDQVLVDNVNASLTNNSYTFSNVTGPHTISVTFAQITHNITATAGAHGGINPSGVTQVANNGNQQYTVSIDSGYYVASFKVDGTAATLDSNHQYTFTNVTADHTIAVTFAQTQTVTTEIPGCATNSSTNYSSGFNSGDFSLQNIGIQDGKMVLQTGNQAINPESIVIPFKQEVAVTFIYEGAGYISDFGYLIASEVASYVKADGSLDWNAIPLNKRHPVFHRVQDDNETGGCCGGGNGILDNDYGNDNAFPTITSSETDLITYNTKILSNPNVANATNAAAAAYGDGTGLPFVVDGDNSETPKDMKKVLGTFDAGTELVFFLAANKSWTDNITSSDTGGQTGVWYTKKAWNGDKYGQCTPTSTGVAAVVYPQSQLPCDTANDYWAKSYYIDVGLTSETGCQINAGWLMPVALSRLSTYFSINLDSDGNQTKTIANKDVYPICVKTNEPYSHVIVGAPANDPNQWILGWDDQRGNVGTCDDDANDMVFKIDRKTGGIAQLQSSNAIVPKDSSGNPLSGAYYTGVTMEVWDRMPCSGKTKIRYWASVDNGANWYEITTWDSVNTSDASKSVGNAVSPWTQGTPEYTYRKVRIDFAGLGQCGDKLIWKAQLESQDQACAPEILDVSLNGTVSTNGSFSRSSPTVLANVSYSGSYETPAVTWTDKTILRGHFRATRIYDPANVNNTNTADLWDAGATLNSIPVDTRKIYFPGITVNAVTNELLATGNGTTKTYTGNLSHDHIVATTVGITNTVETFVDKHTDFLEGDAGGTGTINRYSGKYTITFATAPADGVPIMAQYSYYTTATALPEFNEANVSSSMLGLSNAYVVGKGFTYDFNNDGKFNGIAHVGSGTLDDSDGDWLVEWVRGYKNGTTKTIKKEWLLGAIDHSVPAVESPPGMPKWYYGSDISENERKSYSDYKDTKKQRKTVVYVGARDGMLHAFDAGRFRWGDNEKTGSITENRGYFLWAGTTSDTADYGTGAELWSFIPANLISRLKNNKMQAEDQAYVDASPTLADVYINGAWRTILACAEGNGGDTVFCLDVTDPDNPSFLWEYSDPDLFRSRSSPSIGFGRMVVSGTPTWVALFVSGKSSDSTTWPSIYIVNIETGALIENGRVYLDDADYSERGRGGVPSGQPAIVDSDGNGFIDRLYIGTDKGLMYKVNLPDDPKNTTFQSITHCIINSDFSYTKSGTTYTLDESQRFHPIYASPTVTVNNTLSTEGEIQYNINIFFGTGDSPYYDENINTGNTRYHFFAYTDTARKGECGSSVDLSWYYELPAGQRIWASAFASAGEIFFGTSTAETENPCDVTTPAQNAGQLFIFTTEGTPLKAFSTGNIITSPVVEDEHIYFRTTDGLNSMGGNVYNNQKTKTGVGTSRIQSWEEVSSY